MGGVIGGAIDAIDELTKRQKAVLKLIATNTTITYTEIAEALGINESPVGKHIKTRCLIIGCSIFYPSHITHYRILQNCKV
jgi:FixJ family two-component response regulator